MSFIVLNDKKEIKIVTNKVPHLPSFIELDLKKYNVNPDNLNNKLWNDFLDKIRNDKNLLNKNNSYQNAEVLKSLFISKNLDLNLIKELVKKGVDINVKDKNGLTPLGYLFFKSNKFDKVTLDALIELGASLEINIDQNLDILNVALLNGNKSVRAQLVNYLKKNGISFETSNEPTKYLMSINNLSKNLIYLDKIVPHIKDVNKPLPNGGNAFTCA